MAQVKVRALRPLNGQEIGTVLTYDSANAKRLEESGAVKILGPAKKPAAPKKKKGAKAEPKPQNKMAAAPANKAISGLQAKDA